MLATPYCTATSDTAVRPSLSVAVTVTRAVPGAVLVLVTVNCGAASGLPGTRVTVTFGLLLAAVTPVIVRPVEVVTVKALVAPPLVGVTVTVGDDVRTMVGPVLATPYWTGMVDTVVSPSLSVTVTVTAAVPGAVLVLVTVNCGAASGLPGTRVTVTFGLLLAAVTPGDRPAGRPRSP